MSLEAVKVFFFKFVYFCLFFVSYLDFESHMATLYHFIPVDDKCDWPYLRYFFKKKISAVCVFSACILCVPHACLEMVVATCRCWKWNLDPLKNTCSSLLSLLSRILDVSLCETFLQITRLVLETSGWECIPGLVYI